MLRVSRPTVLLRGGFHDGYRRPTTRNGVPQWPLSTGGGVRRSAKTLIRSGSGAPGGLAESTMSRFGRESFGVTAARTGALGSPKGLSARTLRICRAGRIASSGSFRLVVRGTKLAPRGWRAGVAVQQRMSAPGPSRTLWAFPPSSPGGRARWGAPDTRPSRISRMAQRIHSAGEALEEIRLSRRPCPDLRRSSRCIVSSNHRHTQPGPEPPPAPCPPPTVG
jgi:hypothetical protein